MGKLYNSSNPYWMARILCCYIKEKLLAGGQGFEPRYLGSKPSVLPLDDPPLKYTTNHTDYISFARSLSFDQLLRPLI